MERNENGVPTVPRTEEHSGGTNGCGCKKSDTGMDMLSDSLPLAYAYVPWQKWRLLYSPSEALANGTLFEELNKPIEVYGNE